MCENIPYRIHYKVLKKKIVALWGHICNSNFIINHFYIAKTNHCEDIRILYLRDLL